MKGVKFASLLLAIFCSSCAVRTQVGRLQRQKPAEPAQAETPSEKFPKGYAVTDKINIRAGCSVNYEVLARLEKGQEVTILETKYGWHNIKLPEGVFVWISSRYVSTGRKKLDEDFISRRAYAGIVTGNAVRVRALPNLRCAVLSQVDEGYKVAIFGKKGDWFRIVPPPECSGWVKVELIEVNKASSF